MALAANGPTWYCCEWIVDGCRWIDQSGVGHGINKCPRVCSWVKPPQLVRGADFVPHAAKRSCGFGRVNIIEAPAISIRGRYITRIAVMATAEYVHKTSNHDCRMTTSRAGRHRHLCSRRVVQPAPSARFCLGYWPGPNPLPNVVYAPRRAHYDSLRGGTNTHSPTLGSDSETVRALGHEASLERAKGAVSVRGIGGVER